MIGYPMHYKLPKVAEHPGAARADPPPPSRADLAPNWSNNPPEMLDREVRR